ncbi:MAG: hypothetical protein IT515_15395, partial [Burkholderiales bacterium]|nr:hypothetical protein [Burkholderiales bacterium]
MLARWIRAGLAVALLGVGVARAEPIAIVTDLQGGASLQAGAITVPLAILSELEDGARVQLMSG